ncbi:TPA: Gfo/Idh/MocA family oxidoreductase [Klebsiella pneumoniae]|nr:Gfo/Idh/MocA family oxidoreductase [Klebsiella pneumoniae]
MRIGVVGLGSIAQKAWLPVLGAAESWTLQAAWSPGKEKALRICETWRMPYADSLDALAAQCDAVFVHTSTASHYEVVNHLLNAGVHVCVDKPLADKLSEAETLVELAARRRLTLMVGFNRRFAPLDDYLHVVDTALWLADGQARLRGGALKITPQGEMLYAEHQFSSPRLQVTTSMHRRAGSQREWVQAVTDGGLYAVSEMREWQEECGHGVVQRPVAGWQTTLEQRGFVGCARHFIECVQNQTVPETAGEQALLARRIVEKLWRDAISE